jgi:hypothetical protein
MRSISTWWLSNRSGPTSYDRKKCMGYAKKEKRKISILKGIREKNVCQRAWIKERNKDSPYFQIKGIPPKGRVMIKWVQKYLRIRKIIKIPHTCASWSKCMTWISLDPVFDLARDVTQVCLNFLPTQNFTKNPLIVGWKEGKISNALVMFYTHWVIEWIIWGTYIFFAKTYKNLWIKGWSRNEWLVIML